MNIGITNDHHGVILKEYLTKKLQEEGYNVINLGTNSSESVDYPIYAHKLGRAIQTKKISYGIAICGTGIGMCIALNKMKNVYCAKVSSKEEAILAKEHNNANAISISSNLEKEEAYIIVKSFLEAIFSNEERHLRRVNIIKEYEING